MTATLNVFCSQMFEKELSSHWQTVSYKLSEYT